VALRDLLARPELADAFARSLAAGGVAAIPTETFYGLAADPRSEAGCARIFAIKGRDAEKALPVLVSSPEELESLGVEAAPAALARIVPHWPAPLTAVFPLREPLPCTSGGASLAVRVPAHPELRRLLSRTGPLTGTSANLSGTPPASDPETVAASLGSGIDWLVDGGRTPGGLPSTIVDARADPPRVLRPGAFPWPQTR
jgi:L-threonylcarbamoyladenylate synthase